MNKFRMITIGIVAGIVALSNLGPMIGLALSALIVYIRVHYYMKSSSTAGKIWWAFVGIVGVISAISNVPALFGVAALVVLWMIYCRWDAEPAAVAARKLSFTHSSTNWCLHLNEAKQKRRPRPPFSND